MTTAQRQRLRHAVHNGVFVVLVIVLAGMLAILARQHAVQWDLTSAGRNSLSPASVDVLRKLDGPIVVTAYATPHDPRLGDLRKHIGDFIARYQRAKPDVQLTFIDPRERPQAAARAGVQVNGELVIEYRERSERLTTLSEFDFTNLLIRLSRTEERLVMSLDGHGERSLTGIANHDLGDFGKQLASKGLKVNALNLAIAPQVPDNVSVLVIASPQVDILPVELSKVMNHLERGGNLLWLVDQEPLHGLQELAERLGLVLTPGVVVDPDAIERGGRPVMSVAAPGAYGSHPILANMRVNTMFPFARAITVSEFDGWRSTPPRRSCTPRLDRDGRPRRTHRLRSGARYRRAGPDCRRARAYARGKDSARRGRRQRTFPRKHVPRQWRQPRSRHQHHQLAGRRRAPDLDTATQFARYDADAHPGMAAHPRHRVSDRHTDRAARGGRPDLVAT